MTRQEIEQRMGQNVKLILEAEFEVMVGSCGCLEKIGKEGGRKLVINIYELVMITCAKEKTSVLSQKDLDS